MNLTNMQLELLPNQVTQTPFIVVPFKVLPSLNDYMQVAGNYHYTGSFVRKWKDRAHERALEAGKELGYATTKVKCDEGTKKDKETGQKVSKVIEREVFQHTIIKKRCLCWLKVWRPNDGVYDIHNVFWKAIFDGFVRSGLLAGDDKKTITQFYITFEGIDRTLGPNESEREARKEWRAKGKNAKKRLPTHARYHFEFYLLD